MEHRSFLDVPVGGTLSDDELNLDLGAIGRPGPFDTMALVADTLEERDGREVRTVRLVNQLTRHEVDRAFEKQPPAPGDDEASWRRVQ